MREKPKKIKKTNKASTEVSTAPFNVPSRILYESSSTALNE
jgi:hypothetical protein